MYDNPNRITYCFQNLDVGAANRGFDAIPFQKSKEGDVWDYGMLGIIEDITHGGTPPMISIGTAADADAYAEEFSLTATHGTTTVGANSVRRLYDPRIPADKTSFDALIVARIAAGTNVRATYTAAQTATTGQGCPFVVVDWAN